jgi:opacity protein-like surface antigen
MAISRTFALTLAVLLPVIASAQVNVYFGAGAQGARIQRFDVQATSTLTDTFLSNPPPPVTYSWSTNKLTGDDLGYRAFAGVRVGKYFAVEGGYLNLGEPESNFNYQIPSFPPGPSCVSPPAGSCVRPITNDVLRLQDAVDGYEAYGLGMLPITERLELFAKAGIFAWKSKINVTDTVAALQRPRPGQPLGSIPDITISPTGTVSSSGVDLALGGGINFKMSGNFLLRVEGTWYDIKNTKTAWTAGFDLIYQIPL